MNIFTKYIEYLKDNPNKYWFKRKLYGWGWTPANWKGWMATLVFIAVLVLDFNRIDSTSHSDSDTLYNFIPQAFVFVIIFLFICYKTGEKPKWMWGLPKKDDK